MEKWLEEGDINTVKRTIWVSLILTTVSFALIHFGTYTVINTVSEYETTHSYITYQWIYPAIFFLLFSCIAFVDFSGKSKLAFAIGAVLFSGTWITIGIWYHNELADYWTITRFISPFLVYSFFRGAAKGNSRAIISGVVASAGMLGFSHIFSSTQLLDTFGDLLRDVTDIRWEWESRYHAGVAIYFGVSFLVYTFSVWLLDQFFIKGKDHFKKFIDINAPVRFKEKSNYPYFFAWSYTIYYFIIREYSNLLDHYPYEYAPGKEFYINLITLLFSLIPIILSVLFISKINLAFVMAKRRQPFFIHWLLMIPVINIIVLTIVYNQPVKKERTITGAAVKIDQNQKLFRGFYMLLSLLVLILLFMSDEGNDFLLLIIVHAIFFYGAIVVITFQPKMLFWLLAIMLVGDFIYAYSQGENVIRSVAIAMSAIYSLTLYRHAFYPMENDKIIDYFDKAKSPSTVYEGTIDGNQDMFDEEA